MKNLLFYLSVCFCISCNTNQLSLVNENILDIKTLRSLRNKENKRYKITESSADCLQIFAKKENYYTQYCKAYQYENNKIIDSSFSESKTYHSKYKGLEVNILEENKYNSAGQLVSSEKFLKDLIPRTDSYFNIPIEKENYINGKIEDAIEYNYSISLRNILIQTLKVYLSENIDKKFNAPSLIDYDNYEIIYNNHSINYVLKNKIISNNDRKNISQILNDLNLKLTVFKNFEDNQWIVNFEKDNNSYTLFIYDDSGTTYLEKNKKNENVH